MSAEERAAILRGLYDLCHSNKSCRPAPRPVKRTTCTACITHTLAMVWGTCATFSQHCTCQQQALTRAHGLYRSHRMYIGGPSQAISRRSWILPEVSTTTVRPHCAMACSSTIGDTLALESVKLAVFNGPLPSETNRISAPHSPRRKPMAQRQRPCLQASVESCPLRVSYGRLPRVAELSPAASFDLLEATSTARSNR